MRKLLPVIVFTILTITFLWESVFKSWVPIPSDIIVGHYYPWKDYIWDGRIAGYPINNFHLYDVIAQLYPWKMFTIDQIKTGEIPLWNPYNFTGTPHLANLPTASLYPLNLIFLILPFTTAWTTFISLQTIAGGIFMYLYLKNLKYSKLASIFGGIIFSFSSFQTIRYELGISGHTWIWVPLVLLSIDKIFTKDKLFFYVGIISCTMMILAGYIQAIFYGYIIFTTYIIYKLLNYKYNKLKLFSKLFLLLLVPILLTSIQLIPFLETLSHSSRAAGYGSTELRLTDFLFTWQKMIGFLAPDFFGNPSTHNFWGTTSYTEFTVYFGIIPIIFTLFFIFNWKTITKQKKYYTQKFWILIMFITLLFLTSNPISKLLYEINIPGISTLVPSRLIMVINLASSILAASSFNYWKEITQKSKKQNFKLIKITILLILILLLLVEVSMFSDRLYPQIISSKLRTISFRNLIIPTGLSITFLIYIIIWSYYPIIQKKFTIKLNINIGLKILLIVLITTTAIDLLRHGRKYNTLIPQKIIFPKTKSIEFLQSKPLPPRILITHPELFPSNTNVAYKIAMIDGYDSVHASRIDELLSVLNGQKASLDRNNFSRVTYSGNYKSLSLNLLSPEYIYTLEQELKDYQFELVLQEGKTRLYKNHLAYPRVYLTKDLETSNSDLEILEKILDFASKGETKAIIETNLQLSKQPLSSKSTAKITTYKPNQVVIQTNSNTDALLVLNDNHYPGWNAYLDQNKQPQKILRTNYTFRGIKVPQGKHLVTFIYQPASFKLGLYITISGFIILTLIYLIDKKSLK